MENFSPEKKSGKDADGKNVLDIFFNFRALRKPSGLYDRRENYVFIASSGGI